ncbi:PREDICTED: uncharacterized protein LOC108773843 [Cyphomyrmex costatus]|uniref:uncharacterized protein LOC108773843 n=1 Tax=Cyphomyrmex costatus TaxID=456900 RepID=UPI000852427E|nr:PREDICTED: uncharacterized protein LOC108773843 [Cyphomyrmex costatus]
MATARMHAIHPNGSSVPCRVLLDSACEAHLITRAACNRIGVKRNPATAVVTGINESETPIQQVCDIVLQSSHSNFRINVHCLIVPRITKDLPSVEIPREALQVPSNLMLADREFDKPGTVDILLGAEYFYELLETGKIELGVDRPVVQNTKLGWIVAGPLALSANSFATVTNNVASLCCFAQQCESLNKSLERFWAVEQGGPETATIRSETERRCEELFDKTTKRDDNGRFIVRLPIVEGTEPLGESRDIAEKRLKQMERRFRNNVSLHEQYANFMREYEELGHMSQVVDEEHKVNSSIVYLPHHGVVKEDSTTTRLRVVFDASSKTSSGKSLNDILMVGPTIQKCLFEIMIRFRMHKIALTGDIRQMYRQIVVEPQDRDYQRILWRRSPDEPIKEYKLNTVTYGEASSSYLATKCIYRLAELGECEYPDASRILRDEIYVDDIMTGAEDVSSAIVLQREITELLKSGGFQAHKWCSNATEVLARVSQDNNETITTLSIDNKDTVKALGLEWNPREDTFQFAMRELKAVNTKRQMFSAISKFFDPLGLVGPIITRAKLFMQETWKIDCNWDDQLPDELLRRWKKFSDELMAIGRLRVPRCVVACDDARRLILHGFCDASELAYGACIYMQVENSQGEFSSRVLCSKSRIAPIKTVSLPRLELCGAVLLARLLVVVRTAIQVPIENVRAWSDSEIVLYWIKGDPSRWKPFVCNRVSEIIETLPAKHWSHVSGKENPADVISRGASPRQLENLELWWAGPPWLLTGEISSDDDCGVKLPMENHESIMMERRKAKQACQIIVQGQPCIQMLLENISSLTKIERVLAYCKRFASNARKKASERAVGQLSITEVRMAHRSIIHHVQSKYFHDSISTLKANQFLKTTDKLAALAPFLDEHDILRVGGRSQRTNWSFERKHPILLPSNDR